MGARKNPKPEEIVRQLWLLELNENYGYPFSRIQIEYPITFGRDTSKRAVEIAIENQEAAVLSYLPT